MAVWGCPMHACMQMHVDASKHACMHMHVKHDKHGCLHVSGHLQFLYMYRLPVPKPNHFAFLMFFCFKLIFGGWHPPRNF